MPSLVFYYGVVSASKTLTLLVQRFQAIEAGQTVFLVKPAADTRFGLTKVESRAPGFTAEADQVLGPDDLIDEERALRSNLVLSEECQFMSPAQIRQLWRLSQHVDVHAFGLRTDWRGELFPASAILLGCADRLVEVDARCGRCGQTNATHNLRVSTQPAPAPGEIELGTDNFIGVCKRCFCASS